jgi:hypothetical protein
LCHYVAQAGLELVILLPQSPTVNGLNSPIRRHALDELKTKKPCPLQNTYLASKDTVEVKRWKIMFQAYGIQKQEEQL